MDPSSKVEELSVFFLEVCLWRGIESFIKFKKLMCMYMYLYLGIYMQLPVEARKRVLDLLEQAVMNHPTWVLQTELVCKSSTCF